MAEGGALKGASLSKSRDGDGLSLRATVSSLSRRALTGKRRSKLRGEHPILIHEIECALELMQFEFRVPVELSALKIALFGLLVFNRARAASGDSDGARLMGNEGGCCIEAHAVRGLLLLYSDR